MSQLGDLVYLEWLDHSGFGGGWRERKELKVDVATVHSIGWVQLEDDSTLTLMPHIAIHGDGSPDEVQGGFTVLKSCITRRVKLKDPTR